MCGGPTGFLAFYVCFGELELIVMAGFGLCVTISIFTSCEMFNGSR